MEKLIPNPKLLKSFDASLLLKPPKALSLREKQILSNYDHNCVFLQTPKIKSFFKPTSESIVACEGQSKVKAMEKHETENISPMKACQHSVELPAPTKPLLEVKILEKDEVVNYPLYCSKTPDVEDLFRLNSQNSFCWCHWASNSHIPTQQMKVYFQVLKVNFQVIWDHMIANWGQKHPKKILGIQK